MLLRYPEERRLPSSAMPTAAPTSRVVSLTAEATPALSWGREVTMASVAAGKANAMPADATHRLVTTWR